MLQVSLRFNLYKMNKAIFLLLLPSIAYSATANLAWDAATQPSGTTLLGYKVKYGNQSGIYTNTIDTGNVLSYSVTGLLDDTNYYFVASSYGNCTDTNNNVIPCESVNSNEVTYINVTQPPSGVVTLGNTNIGASVDSSNSNWINTSKVTVGSQDVNVTSISVHVGSVSNAPNNTFQVAIYTDNNGVPGSLISNSQSAILTANSWNTAPISAILQSNSNYWLAYNTNGSSSSVNNLNYDTVSNAGGWRNSGTTFGTWPATFGSFTLADFSFSIYLTGSTGGPPIVDPPTNLHLILE